MEPLTELILGSCTRYWFIDQILRFMVLDVRSGSVDMGGL